MKYIYTLKQAYKVVSKNVACSQMLLKCQIASKGHASTRLQCHTKVTTATKVTTHTTANKDVGCSGFEVFSDGFQDRLP